MSAQILTQGPPAYTKAAQLLQAGRLVALPTETVYGLAADARSDATIKKIYAVKGRPFYNPLITHILRPEDAAHYAQVSDVATDLMARFWPGPLTLVLPRRKSGLAERASAGLDTIALRCPKAPWRNGLIDAGWVHPLVMPSANLSGHVSPTLAAHVATDLGDRIDLIIDGGLCSEGVESTVVRVHGHLVDVLRNGALSQEEIETVTGPLTQADPKDPLASPGMLTRHYAPMASLRLNAIKAQVGETMVGFGPSYGLPNLSPQGDLSEAARNLYRLLRELDGPSTALAIAQIPEDGIGAAINDRLRRAARGR